MNMFEAVFGSSKDIIFSDPAKMSPDELRRYMELTGNAVPRSEDLAQLNNACLNDPYSQYLRPMDAERAAAFWQLPAAAPEPPSVPKRKWWQLRRSVAQK